MCVNRLNLTVLSLCTALCPDGPFRLTKRSRAEGLVLFLADDHGLPGLHIPAAGVPSCAADGEGHVVGPTSVFPQPAEARRAAVVHDLLRIVEPPSPALVVLPCHGTWSLNSDAVLYIGRLAS